MGKFKSKRTNYRQDVFQLKSDLVKEPRKKTRGSRDDGDDQFVGKKLTRNILSQSQAQLEELEEEHGMQSTSDSHSAKKKFQSARFSFGGASNAQEEDSDEEELSADHSDFFVDVDPKDEEKFAKFFNPNPNVRRTLADIIQDKLTAKKTELTSMYSESGVEPHQFSDEVKELYTDLGKFLARYRSGKLPLPLKRMPMAQHWEQLLLMTEPEKWSAAAVYQTTRIFISNLDTNMAQRFNRLVLYPRIRDDICEFKRLNFHLYMAMKKALFKPAAFNKGFLLPLCEAGDCTLREATIICSVLSKFSIPMVHSAVAIMMIAKMDYSGACSIFLKTLLDKKYALAYQVIDAVVTHFLRFALDKRELPVLWHQCLLTFVTRYKEDMAQEQKDCLLDLLKVHSHDDITPEIRRELQNSRCREA